jgi:hypothetical protein
VKRSLARLRERSQPESPWNKIVARGLPARDTGGPRILWATSVGGHDIARTVGGLVATALWLRGAEPTFLLCDAALPACELCTYVAFPDVSEFVRRGPRGRLCGSCFAAGERAYAPLPMDVLRYGDAVSEDDRDRARADASTMTLEQCWSLTRDDIALGEQARAATIRFFGKADLGSEDSTVVIATARRYAAAAIVSMLVAERIIERVRPDVLVAHHGIYVPQGILGEVARHRGVRVVNWGTSYRDRTLIFSHGDTYHRTFLDEPVAEWDRPLEERQEAELLAFLEQRRRGKGDWAWVTPESALRPDEQTERDLVETLGIDPTRPTFGLLTNVLWDAQLYYEGHAFENMLEWLWFTIDHFARHPDRQLIVRIHPHEVKAGNRQPVGPEIAARYPTLPPNVFVVEHDSPLNTYALMALCQAVLIYGTKTGVELTPFGQPVVVAADAWIRGKGLTIDVSTRDEYTAALDGLTTVEPLPAETVTRARRYAYHYFFRRMIPLTSLVAGSSDVRLGIESLRELAPGVDPGLDVICDGILKGTPFVFDD